MTSSIVFTAALCFATAGGVAPQVAPPAVTLKAAVTPATSSGAEIVQVVRRYYGRYGYVPSYRYAPRVYAPYGYRYNYRPYRYAPGYYVAPRYGYYGYGPFGGGVSVGPVNVWW